MSQVADIQECCVELIDGEEFKIKLNVDRIYGLYLMDCVSEHLGLVEKEFFGLRYIHPKEKQYCWLDPRKSIKYQLKEGPYSFYLAVKFFPPHPNTLADEQTRYQFIIYIRELILKKKLSCGSLLGQELSACVVQAEFGDYDMLEDKVNYLNGVYLYPGQDENFIKAVIKLHRQLKGVTTIDCENRFLTMVTKMPNYGIESHEVTHKSSKSSEQVKCLLGIYWGGILEMYDNDTKNLCSWENLISANFLKKIIKLKIREDGDAMFTRTRTVKYRCPTRTSTKRLYKAIAETHTFFRRHSAPSISHGPSFHSKFRFIGKTFSQSRSSLYSSGSRMSGFGSVPSDLNDSALSGGSNDTNGSTRGRTLFYHSSKGSPVKSEDLYKTTAPVNPANDRPTGNPSNENATPYNNPYPYDKETVNIKENFKTVVAVFDVDETTKVGDGPDKIFKKPVENPEIIRLIQTYNLKINDFDDQKNIYYC